MTPMRRESLERHQVWAYLAAIVAGLLFGAGFPRLAALLEALLWPALALLLYATFTQTKLARLAAAFRDGRFLAAALLGNFVILPALVWGLLLLVPDDPAIRLGLALVLLVPCTDWFISFAHQAGGDTGRAVAITPALLIAQMLLLPLYLWLFLGEGFSGAVPAGTMLTVFVVVLALPLAFAFATERWAQRMPGRAGLVDGLAWLPVPLLALVLLLIAASQVGAVTDALPLLAVTGLAAAAFLAAAAACGLVLARLFSLPVDQARTLLFSFSTRNSFVVLPFALALPGELAAAAIVIVFQSLVELFGMLLFLWLVPAMLMPARAPEAASR